jgi:hypothetical protein
MHIRRKPKLVVLGLMSSMPYAGIVFLTMQYLVGFKRLGFDVYYVEEHGKTPWLLMNPQRGDGYTVVAAFLAGVMRRFGLDDDQWAFRAVDKPDRSQGLPDHRLDEVFRDAALVINLHGGTVPRLEHYASGRLVYVGTDPVDREVGLYHGYQQVVEQLEPHCAFFTWGENHGNPDCGVPTSARFRFVPTRQPLVLDLWPQLDQPATDRFTTIANWRQPERVVSFNGETYHWSKHFEFLKFVDLPRRHSQPFELALVNVDDSERGILTSHGWHIRDAGTFSLDLDAYRDYIAASRGEFTVAKDQNVRLRSGWFSDRSASYLACGRPVVTQETGFSNTLPTGDGLFAFSTLEEIADAVDRINTDYARHSHAARAIAHEWFDYRGVLGAMLDHLDCRPPLAASV